MSECAFCPITAKLTAEHVTSEWMNDLFPGENIHSRDARGKVTHGRRVTKSTGRSALCVETATTAG
jgi:hypothetical protein